jgi:predicted DCC family thiol-disulfide oxidoreductase YuxK
MTNLIIVFYDGQCGLCNRLVNLLLVLDHKKRLKFAPLQGQTAKTKIPNELSENLNTMALLKNGRVYTKSDAALEVLKTIGGIFSLFYIFKFIPRFIRDAVYDFISKNRILWFGKSESCRMPTKEERTLFLD